jgi:hypothetical protein
MKKFLLHLEKYIQHPRIDFFRNLDVLTRIKMDDGRDQNVKFLPFFLFEMFSNMSINVFALPLFFLHLPV